MLSDELICTVDMSVALLTTLSASNQIRLPKKGRQVSADTAVIMNTVSSFFFFVLMCKIANQEFKVKTCFVNGSLYVFQGKKVRRCWHGPSPKTGDAPGIKAQSRRGYPGSMAFLTEALWKILICNLRSMITAWLLCLQVPVSPCSLWSQPLA